MLGVFAAPFAMLFNGKLSFACLLVLTSVVINPLTYVAPHFYEIFAEFGFRHSSNMQYTIYNKRSVCKFMSRRRELNSQPFSYQENVLPLNYSGSSSDRKYSLTC